MKIQFLIYEEINRIEYILRFYIQYVNKITYHTSFFNSIVSKSIKYKIKKINILKNHIKIIYIYNNNIIYRYNLKL